jgi:alpha-tubulin suppressor-like RCC1 family protein
MNATIVKVAALAGVVVCVAGCGSSSGGGEPASSDAAPEATSSQDGATAEGGGLPDDGSIWDGSTSDAGSPDGSVADGSTDGGPCAASELLCGGICVANDVSNCGACGNDCTTRHATSSPTCASGQCAFPGLACAAGWGHCTTSASDGCETDLTTAEHCGSCSVACTAPPVCAASGATHACGEATAVAVGFYFGLALMSNHTVYAWGGNSGGSQATSGGQLGNGSTVASSIKPGPVSNITTAKAIAAGDGHACALLMDGTVQCWGDNYWGELGVDPATTPSSNVPVAVAGLSGVTAIAAGVSHTCALLSGGTVDCWGYNGNGELGNSTNTICNPGTGDVCTATPSAVTGLSGATAIAAGADVNLNVGHTCALLSGGTVKCWGYNFDGELGNGMTTSNPVPTPQTVSGLSNALAIYAYPFNSCAVVSGGAVKCWGDNQYDELATGSTAGFSDTPVSVGVYVGSTGSLSVGPTTSAICAVKSDGTVACWGEGVEGELGNGMTNPSSTPLSVSGITSATQAAAGGHTVCVHLSTGGVTCWGSNSYDNLANSSAASTNNTPLPVQW